MRISVETGGFTDAAGVCRTANQTAALLCESLAGKLAGYAAMAGDDTTSVAFAASYDPGARQALETLAELTHAFIGMGRLLSASGANHHHAETASAGHSDTATSFYNGDSLDQDDYLRVAPTAPPASLGTNPCPLGPIETWILDHVEGFVWPGADVELLREAATTWRHAGAAVADLEAHCHLAADLLQDQLSPEVPLARTALAELRSQIGETADSLFDLGAACQEYADAVHATHQRTLALLTEIGQMVVEGLAISAIAAALTGGLGAGAAASAAVARIAAQAPRFHTLLTALRITTTTATTRLRTTRYTLSLVRTRIQKFTRVSARNERGEIRLPGARGGPRPGWLRAHEVPPGHTIDRHVGRSIEDLAAQCIKDKKRLASSFASEADAEQFVEKLIKDHTAEIREWLSNGTRRTLPLDAEFGRVTGLTVTKAGEVIRPTGVRVVLMRTADRPGGWQILTAFPN